MANFTVRIELNQATYDDLERMHDLLLAAGYSNLIEDVSGARFYLPLKEYVLTSNSSAQQVLKQVEWIAASVRPDPKILVTEAVSRCWRLAER
ncbi:hypothetical protein J2125_001398 [Erwinia toletana]|uniref:Phage protein n=1 Tax=Winslowiella toletana TaxID=92490 RepID=A0ABS4P7Y4_9GAMM|nr:type V toxin-antitoxin system endoribonuclease antitoxin GhoS [Winslowiella toletana]MBP2168206.1 hypothetical protein [Winslowiella toletana]